MAFTSASSTGTEASSPASLVVSLSAASTLIVTVN